MPAKSGFVPQGHRASRCHSLPNGNERERGSHRAGLVRLRYTMYNVRAKMAMLAAVASLPHDNRQSQSREQLWYFVIDF